MTYSDLLSSISILTSIVFGFYITHWYSIRDSRTRVVKDYYIEQVKGIKGRVDKFFHRKYSFTFAPGITKAKVG